MNENKTIGDTVVEQPFGQKYNDGFFVNVKFNKSNKSYFFHTDDDKLVKGDKVVVETIRGLELGEINQKPQPISTLSNDLILKPIIRKADVLDITNYEKNLKEASIIFVAVKNSIANFKLDMRIIDIEYTLDASKVIISYISEDRVDFRELLRDLAGKLKCRIELRQIGSRDRSKSVGGIAICGLPLCCATFIKEFDGISINMAKNQCLALNIQKLSGHCGKLICCLKYEDDNYLEARKSFPKYGQKVIYDNQEYKITSFNVIKEVAKLENRDNIVYLPIREILKLMDK